ncbi:hypothetical protein TrVGV298_003065 [Trichoderma virens]|nr:hypothetical protein TrVGV298_003065 [Trichoderma virens]
MPSFLKIKASIKRKWKGDSEASSAPAPTVENQDSALPHATTPSSVIAEIPPATLIAAQLIVPVIPSVPQPPNDEIQSPRPSAATNSADSLSDDNNDLWARAYVLAKKREEDLMGDYEKHIASLEGVPVATKSFSDPHDVGVYVKQLLEMRQKKQIQVSILGRDVAMREQIEKLAKFLIWSDSIVKSAVSAQPYAALAWSGVSLFLPLLISGTKYNDSMLKGFSSISDMQIFWKFCEETYFRPSDQNFYRNLKDLLVELYSFIIEYQARVICHLSKAQHSRAWQSMTGSDDWDEAIKSIEKRHDKCLSLVDKVHKEIIQDKMDDQLQEIQRLRIEILQEMKKDREDQKERELLGDLASMSGDYERYKNINPERVPRTCMWFLTDERFHNWRESKSGDLLWVSAGPGCGKSVLSKSLIDEGHLNPETTVTISSSTITVSESIICYFFFKDGGEGKMDNAHALCAILHQLFIHIPQLMARALASHKTYGQDLMQRTDELWRILVDCANLSPLPIICLLDALDECKENEGIGLINKLWDLYRHTNSATPMKLKFFITSRPYETLKMQFDRLTATSAYLHFDGDDKSGQIAQEINLVIDVKVHHITGGFSAEDRNKIAEKLKSMENRTYLWLYLTIEIIEKNIATYSRRPDMEEFLSKLPSTVSDAYEKILSRSQDGRKVEALLQIGMSFRRMKSYRKTYGRKTDLRQRQETYAASLSAFTTLSYRLSIKRLENFYFTQNDQERGRGD